MSLFLLTVSLPTLTSLSSELQDFLLTDWFASALGLLTEQELGSAESIWPQSAILGSSGNIHVRWAVAHLAELQLDKHLRNL